METGRSCADLIVSSPLMSAIRWITKLRRGRVSLRHAWGHVTLNLMTGGVTRLDRNLRMRCVREVAVLPDCAGLVSRRADVVGGNSPNLQNAVNKAPF